MKIVLSVKSLDSDTSSPTDQHHLHNSMCQMELDRELHAQFSGKHSEDQKAHSTTLTWIRKSDGNKK